MTFLGYVFTALTLTFSENENPPQLFVKKLNRFTGSKPTAPKFGYYSQLHTTLQATAKHLTLANIVPILCVTTGQN